LDNYQECGADADGASQGHDDTGAGQGNTDDKKQMPLMMLKGAKKQIEIGDGKMMNVFQKYKDTLEKLDHVSLLSLRRKCSRIS
jgi:hypothetical protein